MVNIMNTVKAVKKLRFFNEKLGDRYQLYVMLKILNLNNILAKMDPIAAKRAAHVDGEVRKSFLPTKKISW